VICRIASIAALSRRPSGALQARLKDGSLVPVGRTFVAEVRRRLGLAA
jgi:DNA-binding LytR/AlgR family response regulator